MAYFNGSLGGYSRRRMQIENELNLRIEDCWDHYHLKIHFQKWEEQDYCLRCAVLQRILPHFHHQLIVALKWWLSSRVLKKAEVEAVVETMVRV